MDEGDHAQAGEWLEAHDRWFAWAGPEVWWGRANGQLAWAEYHRRDRRPTPALRRGEQALAAAPRRASPSADRRPAPVWGALTRVRTLRRCTGTARAALALADACAAPYERALTLLARAALEQMTGESAAARGTLAAARAICEPLGAMQTLNHITALMDTLTGG